VFKGNKFEAMGEDRFPLKLIMMVLLSILPIITHIFNSLSAEYSRSKRFVWTVCG